jgi:LmbE family N-acetylglucosaminyl deacetylase
MTDRERVLVLDPHTDDGEFGCGGTISRFLEQGMEVFYAAFSTAAESVPPSIRRTSWKRKCVQVPGAWASIRRIC